MAKKRQSGGDHSGAACSLHKTVTEAIKAEIRRKELSYYRIAKETGISSAALSRFRRPGGTLKAESMLVLFDYLGIDLVIRDGKRGRPIKVKGRG